MISNVDAFNAPDFLYCHRFEFKTEPMYILQPVYTSRERL